MILAKINHAPLFNSLGDFSTPRTQASHVMFASATHSRGRLFSTLLVANLGSPSTRQILLSSLRVSFRLLLPKQEPSVATDAVSRLRVAA
jgi:hypothetical protein